MKTHIEEFLNDYIDLLDDDLDQFLKNTGMLGEVDRDTLLNMLKTSGIVINWEAVYPDYEDVHYFYSNEYETENEFYKHVASYECSLSNDNILSVAEILDRFYDLDIRGIQVSNYYNDSDILPDSINIQINNYDCYCYAEIYIQNTQTSEELFFSSNNDCGIVTASGFAMYSHDKLKAEVDKLKNLWNKIK